MKPADRKELFARLAELNPHPTTELVYRTPFELLIAVILSAQATDVGVNKATRKLFKVANTPQAILKLGEDGLKKYINTIGLFNAKAANIIGACRMLVESFDGEVPATARRSSPCPASAARRRTWCSTRRSANPPSPWTPTSSGSPTAPAWRRARTCARWKRKLMKAVPAEFTLHAHHWLILHGRYVCKARKPDCPQCVIRDLCGYRDKTKSSGP